MKKIFITTIFSVAIFQTSNANIIDKDIINESCRKSYNRYYSCSFNQFTTQYLTNTRTFTLPMEFTVYYSRDYCPNKFENGNYYSDYFNLYIFSGEKSKRILPGNNRTKLYGNFLSLKDMDPATSYSTEYYAPCSLIIRKVEIDFAAPSKTELNKIYQQKLQSRNNFTIYKTIKENTSRILVNINQLNLNDTVSNMQTLIDNLNQLKSANNLEEILDTQQMNLLNMYYNRLSKLSNSISNESFIFYKNKIKSIIENISNKIIKKEENNNFSQEIHSNLDLQTIFHEIENEPHFNPTSLQNLKEMMR